MQSITGANLPRPEDTAEIEHLRREVERAYARGRVDALMEAAKFCDEGEQGLGALAYHDCAMIIRALAGDAQKEDGV